MLYCITVLSVIFIFVDFSVFSGTRGNTEPFSLVPYMSEKLIWLTSNYHGLLERKLLKTCALVQNCERDHFRFSQGNVWIDFKLTVFFVL